MQCPVCSHALADPLQERCPQCGATVAPIFERDHETPSAATADPRLKELIEDVTRSLADLPGEAEPSGRDYAAEAPAAEDEAVTAAFALDMPADDAQTPVAEGVTEENLATVLGALDSSLPAGPAPVASARKPRMLLLVLFVAAIAAGVAYYTMTADEDPAKRVTYLFANRNQDTAVLQHATHESGRTRSAPAVIPPTPDNAAPEVAAADNALIPASSSADKKPGRPDNDSSTPLNVSSVPQQPEPSAAGAAPLSPIFSVHTDSYRTPLKAQRESLRLQRLGRDAFVQTADVGPDRWHRVLIGRYTDRTAALDALAEIRSTLGKDDARIVVLDK